MSLSKELPFFATIPHSGESIPDSVHWLQGLEEAHLMRDVDRFVDRLYKPALEELNIPVIITPWHRYVVDLNRKDDEFDATAVEGARHPAGSYPKGLHWTQTTQNEPLITQPMPMELHQNLVINYYKPFHQSLQLQQETFVQQSGRVYHLDLHSMPSLGTDLHPDPGEQRADVVISDQHGKSSEDWFKNGVIQAFQEAGFQVAYNWPYIGGGITKMYGAPERFCHTLQVELNRKLYMDESSKQLIMEKLSSVQNQLKSALTQVKKGLEDHLNG